MAAFAAHEGEVVVAIACDGCGSATEGRTGAKLTALTLARNARQWLRTAEHLPGEGEVLAWLGQARACIIAAALRRGIPMREYATTVVMALSDGVETVVCHVGDGAAVARSPITQEWVALSWPAAGEYAGTTDFMTDDRPTLRVTFVTGGIDRLAIFTDGLERLALDFRQQVPHPRFFDALDARLPAQCGVGRNQDASDALAALLDGDAVCARTDDDKTMIFATLR